MGLECKLFMHSQEGYFGVCFPSCEATREINTKITLESLLLTVKPCLHVFGVLQPKC